MTTRFTTRILGFLSVVVVAIVAAMATQGTLQAQDEAASGIVVGTYQPQEVAQQIGLQQQMMERMQGLQQRMQTAQQQQNQQEMQNIQAEAQQIQQDMVSEFQNNMDAAMPAVAEETGVDIIAIEVSYTAPGIETKDVTSEIVAHMGGGSDAPQITLPQQ